ncbi:cupin domain-containing protein [Streptomyces sp. NPDC051822]
MRRCYPLVPFCSGRGRGGGLIVRTVASPPAPHVPHVPHVSRARRRRPRLPRTVMSPQWSLRFASGAHLTLVAALNGRVWITPADGESTELGSGDIAVLRGPAPYTVAEDRASPPERVITSADYCARTARAVVAGEPALDPRTCGLDETGSALLISGAYEGRTGIGDRLLDAPPDILVVP